VTVKTLEQAIAELQRLPADDQEQIGRTLLSHVEKLRALRAESTRAFAHSMPDRAEIPASTISSDGRAFSL
jgi:hypothetical protein